MSRDVSIEVSDEATERMARLLLLCQVVSEVVGVYLMLSFIERGNLQYRLAWHYRRWRQRYEAEYGREWRRSLGTMLYEAEKILTRGMADNG